MLVQLLLPYGFIVLPESKSDDTRSEEGKNTLLTFNQWRQR